VTRELSDLPIRGRIGSMMAYLGDAQISSSEFIKYKPEVPLGLLKALGLEANSVPLPTEDPASLVMNATDRIISKLSPEEIKSIGFVEVGTESIKDGSLPLSQYALQFIHHDDIISNESKHACVAAVNGVWRNLGDNGLVIASDIATYGNDENTAPSAEFTGGMGSVAMYLDSEGRLLEIYNVRGASSGLTHDFFKPYKQDMDDLSAKVYPIVFGRYSNLANIQRVGLAYESLKSKVNIALDRFSGIVLHAPYPGITKYNLAYLALIDRKDNGDKVAIKQYNQILGLLIDAHAEFDKRELTIVDTIETKVKNILKEVMFVSDNEGNKKYADDFGSAYSKIKPSLQFIKSTGNLYTGSSPLCMMSLLENKEFESGELILWGGYGSGNQAIFMIAQATESTNSISKGWKTQEHLDSRQELEAEQYETLKAIGPNPLDDIISKNGVSTYLKPRDSYYLAECDEYMIKKYSKGH
jgi:3-hydroxy-3-methylglutaryl CoA synthase